MEKQEQEFTNQPETQAQNYGCGCKKNKYAYEKEFPELMIDFDVDVVIEPDTELAQAYIPFQQPGRIYPPEEGLIKGTIYPELYRPYHRENYTKCRPSF